MALHNREKLKKSTKELKTTKFHFHSSGRESFDMDGRQGSGVIGHLTSGSEFHHGGLQRELFPRHSERTSTRAFIPTNNHSFSSCKASTDREDEVKKLESLKRISNLNKQNQSTTDVSGSIRQIDVHPDYIEIRGPSFEHQKLDEDESFKPASPLHHEAELRKNIEDSSRQKPPCNSCSRNKAATSEVIQFSESFLPPLTSKIVKYLYGKQQLLSLFPHCQHVTSEGEKPGTLILSQAHLFFIYDSYKMVDVEDGTSKILKLLPDYINDSYNLLPEFKPTIAPLDKTIIENGIVSDSQQHLNVISPASMNSNCNTVNTMSSGNSNTSVLKFGKQCMERHDKRDFDLDDSQFSKCDSENSINITFDSDGDTNIASYHSDDYNMSSHSGSLDNDDDEVNLHSDSEYEMLPCTENVIENMPFSSKVDVSGDNYNWEELCLIKAKRKANRYLRRLENQDTDGYSLSSSDLDESYFCDNRKTYDMDHNNIFYSNDQKNISTSEQSRTVGDAGNSQQQVTEASYDCGVKWSFSNIGEVYPREYRMKNDALEIYASSSSSYGPLSHPSIFIALPKNQLDGGTCKDFFSSVNLSRESVKRSKSKKSRRRRKRRDNLMYILRENVPSLNVKYWYALQSVQHTYNPSRYRNTKLNEKRAARLRKKKTSFNKGVPGSGKNEYHALEKLTSMWRLNLISNFDYLIRLNALGGRSRHDLGHYPIMPWVLSNFTSSELPSLNEESNFRDLTKPMGALCSIRLERFLEKYEQLEQQELNANNSQQHYDDNSLLLSNDTDGEPYNSSFNAINLPPFMYGSHYSNLGGVVLYFLVRAQPFADLHKQLQGGKFDVADRLFDSVFKAWEMCSRTSPTEVKELTPEWYSDPSFLVNNNNFDFGTKSSDGKVINDVALPPWANESPELFVSYMKQALESDYCSEHLPDWIDLIFGYKQKGSMAKKALNVFYHLSYRDSLSDLDLIEDEDLIREMELHDIADFGYCPTQLFFKPHPRKKRNSSIPCKQKT